MNSITPWTDQLKLISLIAIINLYYYFLFISFIYLFCLINAMQTIHFFEIKLSTMNERLMSSLMD